MVRVRPTGKGQEVAEVAPADCGRGHYRIAPTWAQCPLETCRAMCRQWQCRAEEGCDFNAVDPDHVHRAGLPSQGAQRGG
jgi:hypothetical protein